MPYSKTSSISRTVTLASVYSNINSLSHCIKISSNALALAPTILGYQFFYRGCVVFYLASRNCQSSETRSFDKLGVNLQSRQIGKCKGLIGLYREKKTKTAKVSMKIAPASYSKKVISISLPCKIISLAIAVMAMNIGSVIGIRLLTKNIPIIPNTSVKMNSKSRSASWTEPFKYIGQISSRVANTVSSAITTSSTFSANFIELATFVPVSLPITSYHTANPQSYIRSLAYATIAASLIFTSKLTRFSNIT